MLVIALFAILVAVAVAGASCSPDSDVEAEIAAARRFNVYPLYWAAHGSRNGR